MLRAELYLYDPITGNEAKVYRFASEDLDYDGKFWEARILNEFEIQRVFSWSEKTTNRRRSVSIDLDNHDKLLNGIHETWDLLNKKFILYFDDGSNLTKKLIGNTTEITNFDIKVGLNISETTNLFLEMPVPDAQIAYDYYSDTGINESWNAIPIVFGNAKRLKAAWIDKVAWRFVVCSGEIYEITRVYFDKTVVYENHNGNKGADVINGYRGTPESPEIKVRVFRGAIWEDISGSNNPAVPLPGISFIEFYQNDGSGDVAVEPKMVDGNVPEIFVDVQGVINDTLTACERNPARLLYKLLTNPTWGMAGNGWGVGMPTTMLNFSEAIGYCDEVGMLMDGVLDKKLNASDWVDEICRHMLGSMQETDGIHTLVIDRAVTMVSAAFDDSGESGYECRLTGWSEPPVDQQNNRLRLFYDWNIETGKFNRKPDFNNESPLLAADGTNPYQHLYDMSHYYRVGVFNTATIELPLIKDDNTAHFIAQHNFRSGIWQLKTIDFKTETNLPIALDVRQKITITSKRYDWVAKEFIILEIAKSGRETRIKAREYDSDVYDYVRDFTPPGEERVLNPGKYAQPAKPTTLTAVPSTEIRQSGRVDTLVTLSCEKPVDVLRVVFYRQRGIYTSNETSYLWVPDSNSWEFFYSTDTGKGIFPWDVSGTFKIRAVSVGSNGVCSEINIAPGDSHFMSDGVWSLNNPAVQPGAYTQEGVLTIFAISKNDEYPASLGYGPELTLLFKTVKITCRPDLGQWSSDIAGYNIYRCNTDGAGTFLGNPRDTLIGYAPTNSGDGTATFFDETTAYDTEYAYFMSPVNSSSFPSQWLSPPSYVTTMKILSIDIGFSEIKTVNISDDAISAPKISANAITAAKICAGAIVAGHINAAGIAADCILTGNMTANRICIGGLRINATSIFSENYAPGSAGFILKSDGTAEFTSSVTTGKVIASEGTIGGWTICSDALYRVGGTSATSAGMKPDDWPFWAGESCTNRSSAPFRVSSAGDVTLNSVIINVTKSTPNSIMVVNNNDSTDYANGAVVFYSASCMALSVASNKSRSIYAVAAVDRAIDAYAPNNTIWTCASSGNTAIYADSTACPSIVANCGLLVCSRASFRSDIVVETGIYTNTGDICAASGNVWGNNWCSNSSCEIKKDFTDIEVVIPGLLALPVRAYRYKEGDQNWKVGTFAEDFQREFPYLGDGRGLPSLDGVLLKGVQELSTCIDDLKTTIIALSERISALEG